MRALLWTHGDGMDGDIAEVEVEGDPSLVDISTTVDGCGSVVSFQFDREAALALASEILSVVAL